MGAGKKASSSDDHKENTHLSLLDTLSQKLMVESTPWTTPKGSDVCPRPSRGYPGSFNRRSHDNNPHNKTKKGLAHPGALYVNLLLYHTKT